MTNIAPPLTDPTRVETLCSMASSAPLRVAIQGEPGAYSDEAARRLLGDDIEIVATRDFGSMVSAVDEHHADVCLAPIENSLVGSIYQVYDLLLDFELRVAGETYLRIEHCLLAPPGTTIERVRRVYSHPVALDQCRAFLDRHDVESVATHDTAGSVRKIVERDEDGAAAIAGRAAAERYGAEILRTGIEDDPSNYTRFFLLEPRDGGLASHPSGPDGAWKTSIVFFIENEPGGLHAALEEFARRGIDLTKIESRPARGKPFEYMFYLDLRGRPSDDEVADALQGLDRRTSLLRILGAYPAGRLE